MSTRKRSWVLGAAFFSLLLLAGGVAALPNTGGAPQTVSRFGCEIDPYG